MRRVVVTGMGMVNPLGCGVEPIWSRLLKGDSVLLCEEHGNDPNHTVSRYILEQTPLKLIVYDPRTQRLETITELSILDRIKVSSHVGYNVFGTASAFWQDRVSALNANAARRRQ